MDVPSIGGPRGLFDVFVPGVFLVLNVGFLAMRIASLDAHDEAVLERLTSSVPIMTALLIATGYLAGAVLRLLKTQLADRCSTWWLIHRLPRAKRPVTPAAQAEPAAPKDDRTAEPELHGYLQSFPYGNWLCTSVAPRLGPEVRDFARVHWSRTRVPHLGRSFVNHWKTILSLRHPALYANLLVEESLVRFVASMYYALLVSVGILLASSAIVLLGGPSRLPAFEAFLLAFYVLAIVGILENFRHLRAKEAAIFFSACFEAQRAADNQVDVDA